MLPWAITFTNRTAHELTGTPLNVPLHPTEIYDALLNFVLYLFLAWLFRRKKFDGQVFATYLLCYAITRSFVEYFRGDYPTVHYPLRPHAGAMVSVPIFIAGLLLAALLSRRLKPKRG